VQRPERFKGLQQHQVEGAIGDVLFVWRHVWTDYRSTSGLSIGAVSHWLRITPLHEAARTGDLAKAKALLDAGADLTARDEHLRSTPLAWAAKFGQREMVTLLLERGAPRSLPDDPVLYQERHVVSEIAEFTTACSTRSSGGQADLRVG
jgi:ankyrin repeat protein